ncbi:hypothetical protein FRB99_002089 [Tulasnella sp. 403]|nr:hypothetical protein FRB99_002089 [Tulasnella sp. 403]
MVDWQDPKVIAADAQIFLKTMIAMLGLYAWEVLVTFRYDLSILTGKRQFKYPMAFYMACRYSLLMSLIGINIALNTPTEIACQSLYVFNQLMGNIAIGASSALLMLRTIAIWSRSLYILIPLVAFCLGQWGILLHGVITIKAIWSPQAAGCILADTNQFFLNLIYVYTMTFDLTVLTLSTIGLVRTTGRSDLWALLFQDGIVYFIVAFTANCAATTMLLLNLNPALNIILTVPACVASAIVACRSFVRLSTWNSRDTVLPSHSNSNPRPVPSANPRASKTMSKDITFAKASRLAPAKSVNEGVHISMEAYSTTDGKLIRPDSPLEKVEEIDSDSDTSEGGAVRYTRSERAQAMLSQLPNAASTSPQGSPAISMGRSPK